MKLLAAGSAVAFTFCSMVQSAGATTITAYKYPGHAVKSGSRGATVKDVQRRLNQVGDKCGAIDGIFGKKTTAAVKRFEKKNHEKVNGVVDKAIWDRLFPQPKTKSKSTSKPTGNAATKSTSVTPKSNAPASTRHATLTPLFQVGNGLDLQSVAYANGYYYVGFATSTSDSIIQEYDSAGHLLAQTGVLPIQHCASISVEPSTGDLIVTNGGGTDPTHVSVVDFATQQILSDINLTQLGNSGLSAVDKADGNLWVETAPNDSGKLTFSYVDLSGQILRQFQLANQGVPQGIDVANGVIYYYTDNKITVISTAGAILRSTTVSAPGESEGMVILPSGQIVVGYHYWHDGRVTNTLYEVHGFQ